MVNFWLFLHKGCKDHNFDACILYGWPLTTQEEYISINTDLSMKITMSIFWLFDNFLGPDKKLEPFLQEVISQDDAQMVQFKEWTIIPCQLVLITNLSLFYNKWSLKTTHKWSSSRNELLYPADWSWYIIPCRLVLITNLSLFYNKWSLKTTHKWSSSRNELLCPAGVKKTRSEKQHTSLHSLRLSKFVTFCRMNNHTKYVSLSKMYTVKEMT
jgi:hypothetical protein